LSNQNVPFGLDSDSLVNFFTDQFSFSGSDTKEDFQRSTKYLAWVMAVDVNRVFVTMASATRSISHQQIQLLSFVLPCMTCYHTDFISWLA
jgi:hypothetical protein